MDTYIISPEQLTFFVILGVGLILAVVVLLIAMLSFKKEAIDLKERYSPVIDMEAAVKKSRQENESIQKDISQLRADYKEKRVIFEDLVRTAAIYDDEIELAELGFYKPHFSFDDPEDYKEVIQNVRSRQKQMIKGKTAVFCRTQWRVDNNLSKGTTMTNRNIRLTARAFNNECDAAVASVRWNNILRLEERIVKAFTAINKLNASNDVHISSEYLELKIEELRLVHELAEKKQQIKEEQAEIRRQQREEAKLFEDRDKAIKEEERYQKLVNRARKEAEKASGTQLAALRSRLDSLERELAEAHAKSERAKSMAEQTKSGHVYVISNHGSFGEGVFKIGMTRRLEPEIRVRELGDASVPFLFDTHAMIYSNNAPALEANLHKAFSNTRMNLVNTRREFFNTSLDEIEEEVKKYAPEALFIRAFEAREFRESEAIRQREAGTESNAAIVSKFPEEI